MLFRKINSLPDHINSIFLKSGERGVEREVLTKFFHGFQISFMSGLRRQLGPQTCPCSSSLQEHLSCHLENSTVHSGDSRSGQGPGCFGNFMKTGMPPRPGRGPAHFENLWSRRARAVCPCKHLHLFFVVSFAALNLRSLFPSRINTDISGS